MTTLTTNAAIPTVRRWRRPSGPMLAICEAFVSIMEVLTNDAAQRNDVRQLGNVGQLWNRPATRLLEGPVSE